MEQRIGSPLYKYDEVTSTFDKAAEFEPTHGLAVVAESQTAGRGRLGRLWQSDKGGLYMSIYLSTDATIEGCGKVTSLCAVAVAEALSRYGQCHIKWPNDIVMNGKKICGILTKSCIQEGKPAFACVGIGINANNADFPKELTYASSILAETGTSCDTDELMQSIFDNIEKAYKLTHDEIMHLYREMCITLGSEILVHKSDGTTIQGLCTGINTIGELTVRTKDECITVNSGEVSVRGLYGYV